MEHNIFISHESSSLSYVETLAKMFEENGVSCWYAPRDLDNSGAGKEYDDEIVEAIHTASAIVVILTDEALRSIWVKREVNQAEKQGKMIFPYVISELTENNGLLMRLEDRHLINAYPNPTNKESLLLRNVKLHLKQDVSGIHISESVTRESESKKVTNDMLDLDYEEGIVLYEAEENKDAFLAFLKAAERGNMEAQTYLYKILSQHCRETEFLDDETWNHIEELSDANIGFADLLMHYRYYGMGTQNEIAIKYLQRALYKQVSPYAFLQMGICYGWGMGVKPSDVQKIHYYKKAYDAGCVDANWYLAQLYLYGDERTPIDLNKAESYGKEGAEKGNIRCYGLLSEMYLANNRQEEAQQLAQHMIDNNVKGGYRLMGDYYWTLKDYSKAKEYYQLAVENNDNKAWGDLCTIHCVEEDYDEVFRLAQKGVHENDGFSYGWLGWSYENKEDYEKAWYWYMARVHLYGTAANFAANLYLEHDYLPNAEALEELKRYLTIDTQRQIYESAEALLKIILKEHGEETDLTFEKLQKLPETYDILRKIAEMNGNADSNKELQYIYGRILSEDNGKYHDPFRGSKFILSAAKKNYAPAVEYVFDKFKNEAQRRELAGKIIAENYDTSGMEKYISTILYLGKDYVSQEQLMAWINLALIPLNGMTQYTSERFNLYKAKLDIHKEAERDIPQELIEQIRKDVKSNDLGMSAMGYLNILGEYIPQIFPDYESDEQIAFYHSVSYDNSIIQTPEPLEKDFFYYLVQGMDEDLTLDKEILPSSELRNSYNEMLDTYKNLVAEGTAESGDSNLTTLTFKPTDYLPFCDLQTAVEHRRRAWKLLNASKNAFGEYWQDICVNINDQDKLLEIAEKMMEKQNAQLLLIEFVEVYVYVESILLDILEIRSAMFKGDKAIVVKCLNDRIEEMTKAEIKHHLSALNEDDEIPFMK